MKLFAIENPKRLEFLAIALILTLSFAVRYLAASLVHFDSDEAIQGLMAKHIAEARCFPIMEYGSSHHGALASYLIAPLYFVKESLSVQHLRFYSVFIWTVSAIPLYLTARYLFGKFPAFFVLTFYAFPPVSILETSVRAWPGQAETQLITTLLLWRIVLRSPGKSGWYLHTVYGLGMGLVVWLTPAALPGVFCLSLYSLYKISANKRQRIIVIIGLIAGFSAGYSPGILYHLIHSETGIVTFLTQTVPTLQTPGQILWNIAIVGYPNLLGLQTSFGTSILQWGMGLLFYILLMWGGIHVYRKSDSQENRRLFIFFILYIGIYSVLLLIPRWNQSLETSPRYLFPAFPFIVLLCGSALTWKPSRNILVKSVFCILFMGWLLVPYPFRLTRDQVSPDIQMVEQFKQHGVRYMLTDYWKAYKITFMSNETIIASPQAGPIVVDRYPAYTDRVYASPSPAYFLIPGQYQGYGPVETMKSFLTKNQIAYNQETINDMDLFWNLSKKVLPSETGMIRFGDAR